ncbi:MAG TPA: hypothetical protein PLS37_04465 [Propioniciclava tarda]|nr:hypothetical protein [Propioniciclava tarda]
MSGAAKTIGPIAGDAVDDEFDLPDMCARPQCRQEFRQNVGRGRKANYCSETCRRLADRDYKRAKATVEHFEKLARRSRYDVLAFGRSSDEAVEADSPEVVLRTALNALGRVDAVLRFVGGDADQRLVDELVELRDAVKPLVAQTQAG